MIVMNRIIMIAAAAVLVCLLRPAYAYSQQVPEPAVRDSVIYVQAPLLDSALAGVSVFSILGDNVALAQPSSVRTAMSGYVRTNAARKINGYRIRIFFDNRQSARSESERIQKEFSHLFPEMRTYRTYANPYFKVTVGDFRTRSEAMLQMNRIRSIYPSAFLVKEHISYPAVDRRHPVVADTISVSPAPADSAADVSFWF